MKVSFEAKNNKEEKKGKNNNEPDYIDYWLERQDKQYVKGYFIGKIRPPLINQIPAPAWFYCCFSLVFFLLVGISFLSSNDHQFESQYFILLFIGFVLLIIGLFNIKRNGRKKNK